MGYTHQMAFFYGTHAGNPLELIELGFPSIFCWLNQHTRIQRFSPKKMQIVLSLCSTLFCMMIWNDFAGLSTAEQFKYSMFQCKIYF
jgi:hypothetical protein